MFIRQINNVIDERNNETGKVIKNSRRTTTNVGLSR